MEIWKDIPGYESGYQASNFGNLRSKSRIHITKAGWSRAIKGRPLKPFITMHGRKEIDLCLQNVYERFSVHHLILMTFIGPKEGGLVGCHNDGDCLNNRVDNLRWDTQKANIADKERHGTQLRGSADPRSKITEADVDEIRNLRAAGQYHKDIAKLFGVSRELIGQICRGKKWNHH